MIDEKEENKDHGKKRQKTKTNEHEKQIKTDTAIEPLPEKVTSTYF